MRSGDAALRQIHLFNGSNELAYEFAECCNTGGAYDRSGVSPGSHDLLQWAVGWMQQLFAPKAEVAGYYVSVCI